MEDLGGFKIKKIYNYDFYDDMTGNPVFFGDQVSISYTLGGD